jgi:hypothetical protein
MRLSRTTSAVLAVLLCGGTLYAASGQSDRKEAHGQRSQVKSSAVVKESLRRDGQGMHAVKPSQKRTPEVRSGTGYTPGTTRYSVKNEAKIGHWQEPASKGLTSVNRPHYWVPHTTGPLPYHHRPGYITRAIPTVAMTLSLGGLLYYYTDGIYYRRHSSGFIVVVPPIGLIVPVLPLGYTVFQIHGSTYYYYDNVYYVWDTDRRAYRVAQVPDAYAAYEPGDIIETLPDGAYTVTINGVQYYRFNGVYFLPSVQNEKVVFIVVTPKGL